MIERLCLLLLLLAPSGLAAAPSTEPAIVATTPTLSALAVDPTLTEIAVEFDRPMSRRGWSWCGGGAAYPELTGKPFYRGDRTAVLPVRLQPEKTYFLMVNCPSGQNFRGADGTPVVSTPFRFTTGDGGALISADPRNYAAWMEFRRVFDAHYSYRDRTGTNWQARFDEHEEWVLRSPTAAEWMARLGLLLEVADDPHLYFRSAEGQRQSTHRTRGVYNGNTEGRAALLPGLSKRNELVASWSDGRIGYLAIDGWDNSGGLMDAAEAALHEMADLPVLILDVRANGGGDEDAARRIAAWFIDSPKVYARHRFRDPEAPDGWTSVRERRIAPRADSARFAGRVIVLQGSVCLSSNEAFLLMMRQAPRAVSLGARSGGSSGNPGSYPLPNGVTAVMSRWESITLDGARFEGIGLEPQILFEPDLTATDAVLKEALRRAGEFSGAAK